MARLYVLIILPWAFKLVGKSSRVTLCKFFKTFILMLDFKSLNTSFLALIPKKKKWGSVDVRNQVRSRRTPLSKVEKL